MSPNIIRFGLLKLKGTRLKIGLLNIKSNIFIKSGNIKAVSFDAYGFLLYPIVGTYQDFAPTVLRNESIWNRSVAVCSELNGAES